MAEWSRERRPAVKALGEMKTLESGGLYIFSSSVLVWFLP